MTNPDSVKKNNDVGVADEAIMPCSALDHNDDTIIELADFANFGKAFLKDCLIPIDSNFKVLIPIDIFADILPEKEYPSVQNLIGESDLLPSDYAGAEITISIDEAFSDKIKFTSFIQDSFDSYLPVLGACDNGSIYMSNNLCFGISKIHNNFLADEKFGTVYLTVDYSENDNATLPSTMAELLEIFTVDVIYSNGEETFNSEKLGLASEEFESLSELNYGIIAVSVPESAIASKAMNLDLSIENGKFIGFEPNFEDFIGVIACEEYDTLSLLVDETHICISIAKESEMTAEDILGNIAFEVTDISKETVFTFENEAKFSDGENSGELTSFSIAEERECGYVDMNKDGTVDLLDFSLFGKVFGKSCVSSI